MPAHFLQQHQDDEVVSAGVTFDSNNNDVSSLSTTSSEEWFSEGDLETSGSESDTGVSLSFGLLDSLEHPLLTCGSLSPTSSSDSDADFSSSSSTSSPQQYCSDDLDMVLPLSEQEVDWLSGLFVTESE